MKIMLSWKMSLSHFYLRERCTRSIQSVLVLERQKYKRNILIFDRHKNNVFIQVLLTLHYENRAMYFKC